MIQAITTQRPVSATQPLLQPAQTVPIKENSVLKAQSDILRLSSSKGFTEQEARATLEALEKQYGSFRKPGFFSSPKIDINEALARLKDGKDITVTHKVQGHEVRDKFDSFDELMLFDDLEGAKKDHGVAKPELRLPLLFLEGKKLEAYNSNNDRTEYLSLFGAYADLKRDWRIVVEGKDVKPKDIAAYVVNKGWTASKDPGLATLARFRQLPDAGWQVNGQNVNRDTAYLALITGTGRIQLSGMEIGNAQDFDILMNLVANEANGAVDADLRSRLTALKLNAFNSPGIDNYYTVFKHLSNAQALSYQGNTLSNLDQVFIYDALMGSQKPAAQLPAQLQNALLYLGQDKGLNTRNTYDAWQKLSAGETVVYAFSGGPTGEGLRLTAHSLDSVIAMKQQVLAQRERDQYRPDLKEAKQIFSDRLSLFDQPLANNLERTRLAADKARQDLPIQEARRDQAQRDVDSIKPVRDRAYNEFLNAESVFDRANSRYQSDKRSYDWEKDKYDRLGRDYQRCQRDYERAISSARQYENLARQEDGKVTSDPTNADAHRKQAANYRSQAQGQQNEANRQYGNMQRLRSDMDRQRWDLDRAERQMNQSRQVYWDAKGQMDSKKNEFQRQDGQLNEATGRRDQAERQINLARRTLAESDLIEKLTADAQTALRSLKQSLPNLKSYQDYAQQRTQIQSQAQLLREILNNSTYTSVHGNGLNSQYAPLLTLLNNMDKPAQ
jgi:hypothetical protein